MKKKITSSLCITMVLTLIGCGSMIDHVFYGCTLEQNSLIGFRDEEIDNALGGRANMLHYLEQLDEDACLKLFEEYNAMEKTIY